MPRNKLGQIRPRSSYFELAPKFWSPQKQKGFKAAKKTLRKQIIKKRNTSKK